MPVGCNACRQKTAFIVRDIIVQSSAGISVPAGVRRELIKIVAWQHTYLSTAQFEKKVKVVTRKVLYCINQQRVIIPSEPGVDSRHHIAVHQQE